MDWLVFCLSVLTGITALLLIYCVVLTIRLDREKRERKIGIDIVNASIASLKLNGKKFGKTVAKKKTAKKSNKSYVKGVY